jgi:hypothetical protein
VSGSSRWAIIGLILMVPAASPNSSGPSKKGIGPLGAVPAARSSLREVRRPPVHCEAERHREGEPDNCALVYSQAFLGMAADWLEGSVSREGRTAKLKATSYPTHSRALNLSRKVRRKMYIVAIDRPAVHDG